MSTRIKLAELVDDRRACEVDLGGGSTLPVVYRPKRVTAAMNSRLMALFDANDPLAACKVLEDILIDIGIEGPLEGRMVDGTWGDVVKAGDPVPIEADILQYVPQWILLNVWMGVAQDATPDPQKARR